METDLQTLQKNRTIHGEFVQYFLYQIMVGLPISINGCALISRLAWAQIYSFGGYSPLWPQAKQYIGRQKLQPQDTQHSPRKIRGALDSKLRPHPILQSSRSHHWVAYLWWVHRYLGCGLCFCGVTAREGAFSGSKLYPSAPCHYKAVGDSVGGCHRQYGQQKCACIGIPFLEVCCFDIGLAGLWSSTVFPKKSRPSAVRYHYERWSRGYDMRFVQKNLTPFHDVLR